MGLGRAERNQQHRHLGQGSRARFRRGILLWRSEAVLGKSGIQLLRSRHLGQLRGAANANRHFEKVREHLYGRHLEKVRSAAYYWPPSWAGQESGLCEPLSWSRHKKAPS
ncbi:hypothetical protein Y1Q_0003581 [Alligator mississippiensis]|uniref:Uncharacterized protein n=1 Tax=Alligator mississippiensis TaxID=8496 RepID=A0A151NGB7_ALLMI|nr:hypothetical protein Y1Q_0003581 [Alligator mississippiensis]